MNHVRSLWVDACRGEAKTDNILLSRLSVKKIIVCVYAYAPRYRMWLSSAEGHKQLTCQMRLASSKQQQLRRTQ